MSEEMKPVAPPTNLQLVLHYIRPWTLVASGLTYFLGAGIAKYLGHAINPTRFWAGILAVILLLVAGYVLNLYYDILEANTPLRRAQKDPSDLAVLAAQKLPRAGVLQAAFTLLTAGAAVTVLLVAQGAIQYPALVILGAAFLMAFFYGVPPFRLVHRGYGELTEAILIACLVPALAFILQTGDLHRLLPMLTFPLLAFFLALRLAQSLESYPTDQKLLNRTMMIVLGWQRGMQFHNLLILGGYLLLVMASAFGLAWQLTWPGLLSLPLGIFQIVQMSQIAAGAKPGWRLLRLTSAATFGLTVYLLSFAIWTA